MVVSMTRLARNPLRGYTFCNSSSFTKPSSEEIQSVLTESDP